MNLYLLTVELLVLIAFIALVIYMLLLILRHTGFIKKSSNYDDLRFYAASSYEILSDVKQSQNILKNKLFELNLDTNKVKVHYKLLNNKSYYSNYKDGFKVNHKYDHNFKDGDIIVYVDFFTMIVERFDSKNPKHILLNHLNLLYSNIKDAYSNLEDFISSNGVYFYSNNSLVDIYTIGGALLWNDELFNERTSKI